MNSAVILCGGKGTRLGSLGKKIPKALVSIHNKPIIWYIINILISKGFNHFILPTGYKGIMIKKYIKKISNKNSNYKFDVIQTGVNTSISKRIYKIKNKIISKNFILLNGDAIFDFNLEKIFKYHKQKKAKITFIGCEAILNYGIVGVKNNKIVSFERDLVFNSAKHNFKNYENFEKEFYPLIIKKYKTVFKELVGRWYSIDNQKDIKLLNEKKNNKEFGFINKIKKQMNNEKKFLA